MATNFNDAEAFGESFNTLSHEAKLQYLNEVNDKLRILRKQVLNTQATEAVLDASTRTFAQGWQESIKTDIAGGTGNMYGQTVTIDSKARELYTALAAM